MKGDFSRVGFDPDSHYTSVRHQQGRVLLDRDWNDAQEIDGHWRRVIAGDTFGRGVLAVPADSSTAFQVLAARADATGVHVDLGPGHAWAAGLGLALAAAVTVDASYLAPPLAPATDPASIAAGVRDAVVLEAFEDTVSGFQDGLLLEPALGGPDTTERVRSFTTLKLLRLGPNEDCSAVAGLVDDPGMRGRLSVTPSASIVIAGDCPLEAGGGYTGLEHYLVRIEIASPGAGGAPRFKWSRFNGGLVGRGTFVPGALPGTGKVVISANAPAIDTCGLPGFWLEALAFDAAVGTWRVVFSASAGRSVDGVLDLTGVDGVWPAGGTTFFRLWDGIAGVIGFAAAAPVALFEGIELHFDAPLADGSNYRPGDYWTFPVRTTGASFDPPIWPANAPAQGVAYRRVALAVIEWQADRTASFALGQISDCRHIFRPLTRQKICCSYIVGDGRTSFGDFNSIELALRHLPAAGGEICLLPGLHTTNLVIANRSNVTLRGCGARTRVLPREATLDQPIISILDSRRIEIEHIDFVTLGGTAVWIEGTRPGLCEDVVIRHHRILACIHAVFARNASQLTISNNRIRMFDKQGGLAAIDVACEDVLIERNDISLVPAERTPPVDPQNPEDPIDPTDPCTRLRLVYKLPLVFTSYVNKFWAIPLPLPGLLQLAKPYSAQGGIQLRGGCERVRVLENQVTGGAGNGITLGSTVVAAQPPTPVTHSFRFLEGRIVGRVLGPDGKPMAGVQITLRRQQDGSTRTFTTDDKGRFVGSMGDGTYEVSEGAAGFEIDKIDARSEEGQRVTLLEVVLKASAAPPEPDSGFLYDIAIERNHVRTMGLSGIGAPLPREARKLSALQRARSLLGSPVIGLAIHDNRLVANLRNPFDAAMRAAAQTRGLGGISLGLVDDAAITGNRIEGHGRSGADPVCGVFVQYGESVEIARNTVFDNGAVPMSADAVVADGQRGGVVLGLVANFGLFAGLRGGVDSGAAASAARVLANHVEQPVGCALSARAFGPLMVNDNVFASERSSVGGLDALAGTVLIANLAGVQSAGASVQIRTAGEVLGAAAGGGAVATETQPVGALTRARAQLVNAAFARVAPLLPTGATLCNDNQVRAGAAHRAPLTQLLIGYDDVGFADNQCHTDQDANVFANTFIVAATLRATGNRLRERAATTNLSLLTIATRANNTTFNQGDHCIVAQDTDPAPPATVQPGNQVMLPGPRCASFNMTVALLFKPIAAAIPG